PGPGPVRGPRSRAATPGPCRAGSARPSVEPSTRSAPGRTRPASSSWEASTPESSTATVMPESVEYDQACSGSSHSRGPIAAATSSAAGWATVAVPADRVALTDPAGPADPTDAAAPADPVDPAGPVVVPVAPVAAAGASSAATTATAAAARLRAGTGTDRF